VLTLRAKGPECLWDETLPIEVEQLPDDLAALDRELRSRVDGTDPGAVPAGVARDGPVVITEGRLTIAMETFVRLMVLKTLVAEVSDSIHLRRFCRISLSERVPDESTVRKLTRRLGSETVSNLTRMLIVRATRSRRFRPRAVRVDSTVIEADVKYPTDANLAADGVKVLAREGRRLARLIGENKVRVRDRSRSMGRKLRAVTRTIRRRSGEAKTAVLALTEQTGQLLSKSVNEARKLAAAARRGVGARR
jgi:IS5 family transposase